MLLYRIWTTESHKGYTMVRLHTWEGWFLFGFIPLYIRMRTYRNLETRHTVLRVIKEETRG